MFPTLPAHNRLVGRTKLFTYLTEDEVKGENAAELLKNDLTQYILPLHYRNASEEQFLFDYWAGSHPAIASRVKETRGEINNKISFNFGKSFTRDIVSYFLSKPIQYVQRKQEHREQAEALTNAFDAEGKNLIDYEIATNMSIVGVGYRGVFTDKQASNGTSISLCSLDPRETFVVWSPDKSVGALYCGTMYTTPPNPDNQQCKTVYTIYTRFKKYVFESAGTGGLATYGGMELKSESDYFLGGNLPIVEYCNSMIMIGDWESEISIMDALDVMGSDSVNDIEQFVNSILLAQGFELDDDTLTTLEANKILNIPDVPPGVTIDVRYIAEQLDSTGAANLRDWLEATMRAIVGVPDRKNRAGGGADTGDAVYLRDGWQDIDLVASAKEQFFIDSDRQALATALYIMQTYHEVSKDFNAKDVEIKFSRSKQSNLQAKAQAYATLVGAEAPIDPADALEFADLTNNVSDVVERSSQFAEEKAKKAMETLKATAEVNSQYNNQQPGNDSKTTVDKKE